SGGSAMTKGELDTSRLLADTVVRPPSVALIYDVCVVRFLDRTSDTSADVHTSASGRPRVKAKLGVRALHQLLLPGGESRHPVADIPVCRLLRQGEVVAKVAALRLEQRGVKPAQLRVQARRQGGKALAGAGLDKGANNQGVDKFERLLTAHQLMHAGGIAGSADMHVGHLAFGHDLQH